MINIINAACPRCAWKAGEISSILIIIVARATRKKIDTEPPDGRAARNRQSTKRNILRRIAGDSKGVDERRNDALANRKWRGVDYVGMQMEDPREVV